MSDPKSKIAAGLDARERAATGAFSLQSLQGAPGSLTDIQNITNKLTSKRDRLRVLADAVKTAIEKHTAETEARYRDFGKVRDGNHVTDTVGDNVRRSAISREISAFTRTARKTSAEERTKLVAEVRELSNKLAAVRSSWTDPVALLSRRTLADSKRATYAANLASAGPVAVENTLRDAVITRNAALASAALDRLEAMPKDSRKLVRFSKSEVAESIVREELAKATAFIMVSEIATEESNLANAEADGKKTTPGDKIRIGAMKKELKLLLGGDPEAEDPDDNSPGNKSTLTADEWEKQLNAKFPAVPVPDNVTVIRHD